MEVDLVKETVDLLKESNVASYVTLAELAKELKKPKTLILKHIKENEKLFILSHGRAKRGKNLGICIEEAYNCPDENYMNIEWVDKMRKEKAKYLRISEANNYGYIEGYYIDIDTDTSSKFSEYLWRNTQKKIELIKDYVAPKQFSVGGLGDCSFYEKEYAITLDNIAKLKSLGWEFNKFKMKG